MTTMTPTTTVPKLKQDTRAPYNFRLVWAEKLANGKWATRTETTHTRHRAEAEAFRRRYISATLKLDTGTGAGAEDTEAVLAALIDGYLHDLERRGAGRSDRVSLPKIRDGELGHLFPRELSADVLNAWARTRKVSTGALRRDLQSLKAVLNWAVRTRQLGADDRPHIALPPPGPPRDVWLNEADEQRLWDLAAKDTETVGWSTGRGNRVGPGSRLRDTGLLSMGGAFICLALGTGARREAISDLTWDRVDLSSLTIDFRKPGRRETKKKRVVAPINSRLLPVLQRLKHEWETHRHGIGLKVIDGHAWPRKGVFRILRQGGGFGPEVTPHVFRHTFITLNLRAGVSIWDVSKLAGVSVTVLAKHYAHHAQDARLMAEANKRFAA